MLTTSVTLCSLLHKTANLDLHAVLHVAVHVGPNGSCCYGLWTIYSIFSGRLPNTELLAQHSNNSFFQSFRRVHVSLLYSDTRYLYLYKSLYERTSLTSKVIYINKTLNEIERFRFSQHDSIRKVISNLTLNKIKNIFNKGEQMKTKLHYFYMVFVLAPLFVLIRRYLTHYSMYFHVS